MVKALLSASAMKKPVHCKYCESDWHYSYACPTQRKPIKLQACSICNGTGHTPTQCYLRYTKKSIKPIKKIGKSGAGWIRTRNNWFGLNKADTYECHYCHKQLLRKETTLDHKVPRSRAPELRNDHSNLVPACWTCNGLKGSKAHDDYVHDCY